MVSLQIWMVSVDDFGCICGCGRFESHNLDHSVLQSRKSDSVNHIMDMATKGHILYYLANCRFAIFFCQLVQCYLLAEAKAVMTRLVAYPQL